MTSRGADFSDFYPKLGNGQLRVLSLIALPASAEGLDDGKIFQITPNNSFRLQQQVFFYLGVRSVIGENDTYITKLRLKLWWARQNMEFRQAYGAASGVYMEAGPAGGLPIDREVFGAGPNAGLDDNRYVWVPSPKRLDVTQYDVAPPSLPPPRHSDSLLLDDVWAIDLQDPSDPVYAGKYLAPQVPVRWVSILYPAMGYALGFTWEAELSGQEPLDPLTPAVSLQWSTGTYGGTILESVG